MVLMTCQASIDLTFARPTKCCTTFLSSIRVHLCPSACPFHPSVRLFVYLSAKMSVHLSATLSICSPVVQSNSCPFVRSSFLSDYPSVHSSARPSFRLSVPRVRPFVRSSVRLFVRPTDRPSVYSSHFSVCVSVWLFVRPFVRSLVRPSASLVKHNQVRPLVNASSPAAALQSLRRQIRHNYSRSVTGWTDGRKDVRRSACGTD